jgi:hypothetical protein
MRKLYCAVLMVFAVVTVPNAAQPSAHQGHGAHAGMSMPVDAEATTPESRAKLLEDKQESEFNHHLAGLFVALGAVFILFQELLTKRWPAVKYGWPASFLASGLFVLVCSDTELWPFGHRPWLDAMTHNAEVLQHKTFAVLLLVLGLIEWRRARGTLTAVWSGWVFPVLAIGGSLLLLVHQHEGGMHGPDHMQRMARIQSEHLSYSIVGGCLALTKGLSEIETDWRKAFNWIWPLVMMVLGILLTLYRE